MDAKRALRARQLALREALARQTPDAGERAASVFPVVLLQTRLALRDGLLDPGPTSKVTTKLNPDGTSPVTTQLGTSAAQPLDPEPASPRPPVRALHGPVVAGTWPMKTELDPRPVMRRLEALGATLALPRVVRRGQPLTFHAWTAATRFVSSRFGVTEPEPETPVLEPDVLLVPLLAFDRTGGRLGYGGGFYDATLASLRARRAVVAVGVCFAGLEVTAVPMEPHDQRLDAVCTEREWLACP